MSEILELAWLFCKRAKDTGMDKDSIRWVLEQALQRFDTFEFLTHVSVNRIELEERE